MFEMKTGILLNDGNTIPPKEIRLHVMTTLKVIEDSEPLQD